MAGSVFEFTARELERRTQLERLETRGTLRLALKQAGMEPRVVTGEQMSAVLRRVLPAELRARGVEDAERLCELVAKHLESSGSKAERQDSPEAVFRRLGKS